MWQVVRGTDGDLVMIVDRVALARDSDFISLFQLVKAISHSLYQKVTGELSEAMNLPYVASSAQLDVPTLVVYVGDQNHAEAILNLKHGTLARAFAENPWMKATEHIVLLSDDPDHDFPSYARNNYAEFGYSSLEDFLVVQNLKERLNFIVDLLINFRFCSSTWLNDGLSNFLAGTESRAEVRLRKAYLKVPADPVKTILSTDFFRYSGLDYFFIESIARAYNSDNLVFGIACFLKHLLVGDDEFITQSVARFKPFPQIALLSQSVYAIRDIFGESEAFWRIVEEYSRLDRAKGRKNLEFDEVVQIVNKHLGDGDEFAAWQVEVEAIRARFHRDYPSMPEILNKSVRYFLAKDGKLAQVEAIFKERLKELLLT